MPPPTPPLLHFHQAKGQFNNATPTHTTQHDMKRQPVRDGSVRTQGTGVPVTIHSCGRAFRGNKGQGDSPVHGTHTMRVVVK